MKLSHCLVGCALLACAGVAQAAVITVANGSFETGVAPLGAGEGNDAWSPLPASAPGVWEYTANGSSPYGVYGVDTTVHPPQTGAHFYTAADGNYVLNLGAAADGSTPKQITQALPYTVTAGDVFTLDFYVGKGRQSNSGGAGDLTASILVGGINIATNNTAIATGDLTGNTTDTWYHKTVTGTATGTGALSISFAPNATAGGAPWIDNVTMSVSPAVPEPASLGLLSLAGLALVRRRK